VQRTYTCRLERKRCRHQMSRVLERVSELSEGIGSGVDFVDYDEWRGVVGDRHVFAIGGEGYTATITVWQRARIR
jgi:hypothetical protein